tara:strand:+ start:99 stop:704 length:606 start_codon:yes stop_codon:yes gene_type:complete
LNLSKDDNRLSKRLQQDIVKIAGKTIFINPFLYWRRMDQNTNRWLREPGQLSEEQISTNRKRFYPELEWEHLNVDELQVKDGTIEMFLKTLDLISTFHPYLNSAQLMEVERKMSITKKLSFEKWIKNSFQKKLKADLNDKRRYERIRFFQKWREWFSLEETQRALLPFFVIIFISSFIGWSAGISKNSCNPYFESTINEPI